LLEFLTFLSTAVAVRQAGPPILVSASLPYTALSCCHRRSDQIFHRADPCGLIDRISYVDSKMSELTEFLSVGPDSRLTGNPEVMARTPPRRRGPEVLVLYRKQVRVWDVSTAFPYRAGLRAPFNLQYLTVMWCSYFCAYHGLSLPGAASFEEANTT